MLRCAFLVLSLIALMDLPAKAASVFGLENDRKLAAAHLGYAKIVAAGAQKEKCNDSGIEADLKRVTGLMVESVTAEVNELAKDSHDDSVVRRHLGNYLLFLGEYLQVFRRCTEKRYGGVDL